jgi:hypothetical protein
VREIDQALKVTNATLVKVPFDLARWQQIAADRYPKGLPKPYSDDPTQWLFHGHPQPATDPLQVAVARLVGYRWPAETDTAMELSDEAGTWIARCDKLAEHTDDDGIVCLPSVRGETPAHDRLLQAADCRMGNRGTRQLEAPPCWTSCWPTPTAPAKAWTCGCAKSSSSNTPNASTTAPSFGMCGTARKTALPRWSTTTSSTPKTWNASSTPTWAHGLASKKKECVRKPMVPKPAWPQHKT